MKNWMDEYGYMISALILLTAIAFGTIWTAYESHIANIGVVTWQHEFSQINQPDGPPNNSKKPEPPRYNQ